MVEPRRSQITIWRMRIACWLNKATHIYPEYVILMTFHCKNSYANTAQYCFYACISPLVFLSSRLGCIWLSLTIFDRLWPYLTVFDLFDCIWLYLYWLYLTVLDRIWPYLTAFDMFDCIRLYLYWMYLTVFDLYDLIWRYLTYLTVFVLAVFDCIWLNLEFFNVKRCGTYSNR